MYILLYNILRYRNVYLNLFYRGNIQGFATTILQDIRTYIGKATQNQRRIPINFSNYIYHTAPGLRIIVL